MWILQGTIYAYHPLSTTRLAHNIQDTKGLGLGGPWVAPLVSMNGAKWPNSGPWFWDIMIYLHLATIQRWGTKAWVCQKWRRHPLHGIPRVWSSCGILPVAKWASNVAQKIVLDLLEESTCNKTIQDPGRNVHILEDRSKFSRLTI